MFKSVFVTNLLVFGFIWLASGIEAAQLNLISDLLAAFIVIIAALYFLDFIPQIHIPKILSIIFVEICFFAMFIISVTLIPNAIQFYIEKNEDDVSRYEVMLTQKTITISGIAYKRDSSIKTDLCPLGGLCTEEFIKSDIEKLRANIKKAESTKQTSIGGLTVSSPLFNSIVYFLSNFIVIGLGLRARFRHQNQK